VQPSGASTDKKVMNEKQHDVAIGDQQLAGKQGRDVGINSSVCTHTLQICTVERYVGLY